MHDDKQHKRQNSRMLKCQCMECLADGTPYIVRGSKKTLLRGELLCPEHQTPMVWYDNATR